MRVLAFFLLLLCSFCVASPIFPCQVTLEQIKQTTEDAYAARAGCERTYFTSSDCDTYWRKMELLLEQETDFRDCRKQTIDNFLTFLAGSNWTNGEIARQAQMTRDVVAFNAAQTQALFTDQSKLTRTKVEEEASNTQRVLTAVTNQESSATRNNLTFEAQNTRNNVSLEAQATRSNISAESVITRAKVNTEEQLTRDLVTSEASTTRSTVVNQHTATRTSISQEANTTRMEVDMQNALTRNNISQESNATRNTLSNTIVTQGQASRANTSGEATLTRATVSTTATDTQNTVRTQADTTRTTLTSAINSDGSATRAAISVDGSTTRQAIANEAAQTRTNITNTANGTNNVIKQGVQDLTNTLNTTQTKQNSNIALLIKILIEGSFSANPSSGRVDLFQRPERYGGYFETMRTIVREVVAYNQAQYNLGTITNIQINQALGQATQYENDGNYRRAWEQYRIAYLAAVTA